MLVAEWLWPRIPVPAISGWYWRIGIVVGLSTGVSALAHLARHYLLFDFHVVNLPALVGTDWHGTLVQAVIAVTTQSFFLYWFHRAVHLRGLPWQVHQLHHASLRVSALTGAYYHPLELVVSSFAKTAVVFMFWGCTAEAAAAFSAMTTGLSIFSHSNLRTPVWIGHLLPRPESHYIHHEYRRHRMNFGSLPIWDMMFGTFENGGARPIPRVGFEPWMEHRLGDMLVLRDVNAPGMKDRPPVRLLPECMSCASRFLCRSGVSVPESGVAPAAAATTSTAR
jgi:sterol desaturase/sphingolipid hydroxylase (fatty acid hydroxylase superfamily)